MVTLTLGAPQRGSANCQPWTREAGPVHRSLSSRCHCRANSAFAQGFVSSMRMEELMTLGTERSEPHSMRSALRK